MTWLRWITKLPRSRFVDEKELAEFHRQVAIREAQREAQKMGGGKK